MFHSRLKCNCQSTFNRDSFWKKYHKEKDSTLLYIFQGKKKQKEVIEEAQKYGLKVKIPYGPQNQWSISVSVPSSKPNFLDIFLQFYIQDPKHYVIIYPSTHEKGNKLNDKIQSQPKLSIFSNSNQDSVFFDSTGNTNEKCSIKKKCHFPNVDYIQALATNGKSVRCLGQNERDKLICSKFDIPPRAIFTSSWTARQMREYFNYPRLKRHCNITVGITSLQGCWFKKDIEFYVRKICGYDIKQIKISTVLIDGAKCTFDLNSGDAELAIDMDSILGVNPFVHVVIYKAPNSAAGFFDAFATAIFDEIHKPNIISCSQTFPEWVGLVGLTPPNYLFAFNHLLKIATKRKIQICVSSGDTGATSFGLPFGSPPFPFPNESVMFPASSPYVTSVGGLTIARTPCGIAQTAWSTATPTNTTSFGSGGGLKIKII